MIVKVSWEKDIMVQTSQKSQEYEINFKESYNNWLPPSSDEGNDSGLQTNDPLLNSAKDDALSLQQEPLHSVSVRSTNTTMLRRRGKDRFCIEEEENGLGF